MSRSKHARCMCRAARTSTVVFFAKPETLTLVQPFEGFEKGAEPQTEVVPGRKVDGRACAQTAAEHLGRNDVTRV